MEVSSLPFSQIMSPLFATLAPAVSHKYPAPHLAEALFRLVPSSLAASSAASLTSLCSLAAKQLERRYHAVASSSSFSSRCLRREGDRRARNEKS